MKNAALEEWVSLLGRERVVTFDEALADYGKATFPTENKPQGILIPRDNSEVEAIVNIAKSNTVSLYPISCGKNWGLGSRVPTSADAFILDLGQLNKITDHDSELGTITVEPGVSFQAVQDYLTTENSDFFLNVIGGPPGASVIGNLVERGDGIGPLGDRANHACNYRVVLGTGKTIKTGYGRLPGSLLGKLSKWGIGPSIDGLFCQSNFGVVTEATFWLQRKPRNFQTLLFTVDNEQNFFEVAIVVRDLIEQNVLTPFSLGLWNSYKYAATNAQHPSLGSDFDIGKVIEGINPKLKGSEWFGVGGIYSGSQAIGTAKRNCVKKALSGLCKRLVFLGAKDVKRISSGNTVKRTLGLKELVDSKTLQTLYEKSVFLGNPTYQSVRSTYW